MNIEPIVAYTFEVKQAGWSTFIRSSQRFDTLEESARAACSYLTIISENACTCEIRTVCINELPELK